MLIAGAQNALAALSGCEGTVYLKLPDGWTTAYTVAGGQFIAFKKSTTYSSWYEISTSAIGGTNSAAEFFISSKLNDYGQAPAITPTVIDKGVQFETGKGFSCADFGKTTNELWIQPYPGNETKTYLRGEPPDVKYFYIFLPQNEAWKSATPVIVEDGNSRAMDIDAEHCGWYFRRYVDEELPASVLIKRDDDEDGTEAIGVNGAWETNPASPEAIPMDAMFNNLFEGQEALYFVADEEKALDLANNTAKGWDITRPDITGKCGYDLAALIYDTDASLHGAFTCNPDWSPGQTPAQAHANACYSASAKFQVASAGGEVPCIGVTKGMVEETLTKNAKGQKRMKLTAKGQTCFGSTPDAAFAAMFDYTEGINEEYCFNMTFTQAADGKYEFESDTYLSPGATVPGGFYPAEQEPEATMRLSPALPAAENKRKAEGPTFFCADYNNQTSSSPEGLRTVHPTHGVPMSDLICNGGGWDGGIDCEGYFQGGEEFKIEPGSIGQTLSKKLGVTWEGDGWGWACEQMAPVGWKFYETGSEDSTASLKEKNMKPDGSSRWTSGKSDATVLTGAGRNQHFCFESHASFRFKKGLKFSFRGDDDIWVFINDRLAVDLGGTHLAAPGFVDLDKFMPEGEVGFSYPIDIFFCDRRTTMSNVHIKTNMFIEQTTGISYTGKQDKEAYKNHDNVFKICYKESGGGSCAAAMGGSNGEKEYCGDEITAAGLNVAYELTTDPTASDPNAIVIKQSDFAANPIQANGGINVTDLVRPIINEDKLKDALPGGTYYLVIRIGSDFKAIKIQVKGNVGVANRDAVTVDDAGNYSLPYTFKSQAMASTAKDDGSVDPSQLVPLYIAAISDPCTTPSCTDPLVMQSAENTTYTLEASKKAAFFTVKDGVATPISATDQRTIGEGGIDTIYVTVPMNELDATEELVTVKVKGSTRVAEILFFAPKLVFVKSETSTETVTGDPDTEIKLKGSSYPLYVLALNGDNTPCLDCNFSLSKSSTLSSTGLNHLSGFELVNGRATILISSSLVYLKSEGGTAATFVIVGPSSSLTKASYGNMQFQEPPVPTPQFADIYDVRGKKPASQMNVPTPYFSVEQEYLDGIGDSLVIYYHREFHKDSLPDQIVVRWSEDEKDSVLFTHEEIVAGASCGDTKCSNRISLSGKEFSKDVKTSGSGTVKSWATYCPKFKEDGTCSSKPVTSAYEGVIYDRIAPIIVSARTETESGGSAVARLKVEFSEPVQKTTAGVAQGDNVFLFYINNGKNPRAEENMPLATGFAIPEKLKVVESWPYDQSGEFPQAGDYIHFRTIGGEGLIMDQSDYAIAPGADTLRIADDATHNWNVAPGYEQTDRLPSPWVLISGKVSFYVVRLLDKSSTPLSQAEMAKLPVIDVFTFDADKDEKDFNQAIEFGTNGLNAYGFAPHGWYVKSDLGALIESKEEYSQKLSDKKDQVYLDYDVQYFTNLGTYVAGKKGRIYCDDKKNQEVNHQTYFDGKNCVDVRRNFYITWNLKSNEDRFVGAGAYIAKIKTFSKLGEFGKFNTADKTEMWGVRHGDGKSAIKINVGK